MTTHLIATDNPFSASEQDILRVLADTLVPASEDGRMISAGELDVAGYVAANAEPLLPALKEVLAQFGAEFCALPLAERVSRVQTFSATNHELFATILFNIYACYYQEDQVLVGIGMEAGPPFPRGNTVEAGDLSLLDPVIKSDRSYRR